LTGDVGRGCGDASCALLSFWQNLFGTTADVTFVTCPAIFHSTSIDCIYRGFRNLRELKSLSAKQKPGAPWSASGFALLHRC
jgi:hypothetical protein